MSRRVLLVVASVLVALGPAFGSDGAFVVLLSILLVEGEVVHGR